MTLSQDLTEEVLGEALPGRALRSYAALVSTGAAAHGWAVEGAPHGAVIVAGHQISPRGHAGRPWRATPGRGLGFSLLMRPSLPPGREGWLHHVVLTALADVCGEGAAIEWPDEVRRDGAMVAVAGVKVGLGDEGIEWAVVDVLLPDAEPPRGELLAAVLGAIDAREAAAPSAVIAEYDRLCATIGRQVRVRFLAGTGPTAEGRAVATLDDGALVLETTSGRRGPVRPQDVRGLEAGRLDSAPRSN